MKVLIAVILSLLLQLGLAILGWGGFAAFFSHPPFVTLVVATIVLSAVALFSRGNLSSGEREDRRNRWVLIAFGLLAPLLAFAPAYTDRLGLLTFGGESVRW
ncbi:MAG TPA: hypothetical protein VHB68_02475, partial [Steroidobacteraceae bacterium]|nr:hypothetical protein [Steroidobacteraceae bacterium]